MKPWWPCGSRYAAHVVCSQKCPAKGIPWSIGLTRLWPHMQFHKIMYLYNFVYEPLTISPVAAYCDGACGKRSSIECVHIDRCLPQKSWRWHLRSSLNFDSDKFRCFNHRHELESTVFLPNFRLVTLLLSRAGQPVVTMMRAIYSARVALFIHGIT